MVRLELTVSHVKGNKPRGESCKKAIQEWELAFRAHRTHLTPRQELGDYSGFSEERVGPLEVGQGTQVYVRTVESIDRGQ